MENTAALLLTGLKCYNVNCDPRGEEKDSIVSQTYVAIFPVASQSYRCSTYNRVTFQ